MHRPSVRQTGEEALAGLPRAPGRQARSSLVELLQCSLRAVRSRFCIAERQQLRSGIGQNIKPIS